MNVPVYPLHKAFGVKRAVVSTYQAASGAGLLAMQELEQQATDFANGDDWLFGDSVVATNGAMHAELRQFLTPTEGSSRCTS